MKSRVFFLFLMTINGLGIANNIAKIKTSYNFPVNTSINDSIHSYLKRYIGEAANQQSAKKAESFLRINYFVAASSCSINKDEEIILWCNVAIKHRVSDIKIINFPSSLLINELKQKIPIQTGHLIDLKREDKKEIKNIIRLRTKSHLRKNGYYVQNINVVLKEDNEAGNVVLIIELGKGNFARVLNVKVEGDIPFSKLSIQRAYKRMCFSFKKIIDAFARGTLSCYSRDLENKTTQNIQNRLAQKGYVQSRVRVTRDWLSKNNDDLPSFCKAKSKGQKKCVNLRVLIDPGPRFTWSINFKDNNNYINRSAFQRFISSLFGTEQLYRILVGDLPGEISPDHKLIKETVTKQVTFRSAKIVDERELQTSSNQIKQHLIKKGYPHSEVIPSLYRKSDDHIHIDFNIYTGEIFYIRSVSLQPNYIADQIPKTLLKNVLPTRSAGNSGIYNLEKVQNAKKEIKMALQNKGFIGVEIKTNIAAFHGEMIDIDFYIKVKDRLLIDKLEVKNGISKLNEEIVPLLKNCDNYKRSSKINNLKSRCKNSSFIQNDLEEDAKIIENYYVNQGYIYTMVKPNFSLENSRAKVQFLVYDERHGPDSKIPPYKQNHKGIIISGIKDIKEPVIRRYFPKPNSEKIAPLKIKKGISYLRESARFSRIDHKIVAGEQDSDDVYFLIHFTERPSLSLDIGASFSTDNLFGIETQFEEQNLLSSMLKMNTSLNTGLFIGRQSSLRNEFVWPFIFGKPLKLSINAPILVYKNRPYDKQPYRKLESRISANFEWRASQYVRPFITYRLSGSQKINNPSIKKGFEENLKSLDGLIDVIKQPIKDIRGVLKPGISILRLDNPYDPQKGFHTNNWLELSGGPLFGNPGFLNFGTQNRFYIPLGPSTLALRATFMRAFISPSRKNWEALENGSSMTKIGGDRNVRGYDFESIGLIKKPKGKLTSYAGYFFNVANIEFRFPITKKSDFGNFSGALFLDQGSLMSCSGMFGCLSEDSIEDLIIKRGFALSVGAGIRYALPVGPLSLDYAVSPIHANRWRIHLIFGYAF